MKSLKSISKFNQQVLNITLQIQEKFPETYNLLLETPLYISENQNSFSKNEFKSYISYLKLQLYNSCLLSTENINLKTILIFKHNNSFMLKMPVFLNKVLLSNLNDYMIIGLTNTDIVTQYQVEIPTNYIFDSSNNEYLTHICNNASKTIDYHFITINNVFDVI